MYDLSIETDSVLPQNLILKNNCSLCLECSCHHILQSERRLIIFYIYLMYVIAINGVLWCNSMDGSLISHFGGQSQHRFTNEYGTNFKYYSTKNKWRIQTIRSTYTDFGQI